MTENNNSYSSAARQLINARAGGKTRRCHTIPHNLPYTVAEHSWGVAMLMFYIWPEDFPRLAIYCLTHDISEAWIGDIPAPILRYTPGLSESVKNIENVLNAWVGVPSESELSVTDHAKLKACDKLDFWLWARDQQAQGNRFAQDGLMEIERYFTESPLPEEANIFYEELRAISALPTQCGVIKEILQ